MNLSNCLYTITRNLFYLLLICLLCLTVSCKKYLDKKSSDNLVIPTTLAELQLLLDNQRVNELSPDMVEVPADDYFLLPSSFNTLWDEFRLNYTWDANARITNNNAVWINPYYTIYDANYILVTLPTISFPESQRPVYNSIKGAALFQRAFMFHELAQLFCQPYSSTADKDPGLMLRLGTAINEPVFRATVQQTYDRILADLTEAAELLPETQINNFRPVKGAAYAELARVYLSMRDYVNAELYADKCLAIKNTLLDYNSLNPSTGMAGISPLANPEVLLVSNTNISNYFGAAHVAKIDPQLMQSYSPNDLRRTICYASDGVNDYWRGSYATGYHDASDIFVGLAIDEVYLVRAESRIKNGKVSEGMDDLNTLLRQRFRTGTFTDITASNATDALSIVRTERRKSLMFRGLRWSDLRRYNLEGAGITLTRTLSGQTYTLPPLDPRWVLLIPELEIQRTGVAQNAR